MSQVPSWAPVMPAPEPEPVYWMVTSPCSASKASFREPITSSMEVEPLVLTVPDSAAGFLSGLFRTGLAAGGLLRGLIPAAGSQGQGQWPGSAGSQKTFSSEAYSFSMSCRLLKARS